MGFQDMKKVVHEAASRKGGKVRKRKGFAVLSPEKLKEVSARGGKAAKANRDNPNIKGKENRSDNHPNLADVLGDINEGS